MMGKKDPHQDPGSRSSSEEAEEEEVYVVEAIKASRWDSRKNQTRCATLEGQRFVRFPSETHRGSFSLPLPGISSNGKDMAITK